MTEAATRRFEVLKLDTPTATGRVYPKSALDQFEKLLSESGGRIMVDMAPDNLYVDLVNVVYAITDIELDGDTIVATARVLNEDMDKVVTETEARLSPVGVGRVGEDGVISDYSLTKISIIP